MNDQGGNGKLYFNGEKVKKQKKILDDPFSNFDYAVKSPNIKKEVNTYDSFITTKQQ